MKFKVEDEITIPDDVKDKLCEIIYPNNPRVNTVIVIKCRLLETLFVKETVFAEFRLVHRIIVIETIVRLWPRVKCCNAKFCHPSQNQFHIIQNFHLWFCFSSYLIKHSPSLCILIHRFFLYNSIQSLRSFLVLTVLMFKETRRIRIGNEMPP